MRIQGWKLAVNTNRWEMRFPPGSSAFLMQVSKSGRTDKNHQHSERLKSCHPTNTCQTRGMVFLLNLGGCVFRACSQQHFGALF